MLEENLITEKQDPSEMSPHKLAFVGDAVFELIVRDKIALKYMGTIGILNDIKVKNVCCTAQSELYEKIKNILTEEEIEIYKRGRNAHVGTVPKKVSAIVYHRSTGVEALFGFLYLSKQIDRLQELASKIFL